MAFRNKKGLSDVVTTVLIILFAIVAVAVVGGIVMNQINKAGKNIDKAQVCTSNKISPISCVQDGSNVLVGYQYKSKSSDVSGTSSITASFESGDGSITSASISPSGLTLGSAATSIISAGVSGSLKNVKLASTFTMAGGGESTCNSEALNCEVNVVPQQGLTGYWSFDGGNAEESTGKGLTGNWIASGAPNPTYSPGAQGQYLRLNNLGSLQIPLVGGSGLAGNAISTCAWVSFDTIGTEQQIVYIQVPGMSSPRFTYYSTYCGGPTQNCVHFGTLTTTGAWGRSVQTGAAFTTPNIWYHACATFNSTNGQTISYINGVQNGITTNVAGVTPGTPTYIYWGSSHPEGAGSRKLDGNLDEVMVYNRVLTAPEVSNIYSAQRPKFP
ncbi:MAG: LamG domain-containing protein [Nanoarchaeota archaeon]|nr:LamG domain-containing protein [Nanoarchaeota archaeon]